MDIGDEEVEHSICPSSKRVRDDSPSEAEVIDLDDLVKPISMMNFSRTISSSRDIDSRNVL